MYHNLNFYFSDLLFASSLHFFRFSNMHLLCFLFFAIILFFCFLTLLFLCSANHLISHIGVKGFGAFLTPGSVINQDPDSGGKPGSYFWVLKTIVLVKILKFCEADPRSGMEKIRIRDPGWKKFGSRIRDKHPGSATLLLILCFQLSMYFPLFLVHYQTDSFIKLTSFTPLFLLTVFLNIVANQSLNKRMKQLESEKKTFEGFFSCIRHHYWGEKSSMNYIIMSLCMVCKQIYIC